METIFNYICENAQYAHFILFGLIILTGFNVPISEDLLLLTAGALASACVPENTFILYGWVFCASLLSAWIPYWLGRLLGPKLFNIKWFSRIVTHDRLEKLKHYYQKFGIFMFIVNRFVPGGIRNAVFISSGLTKMPFYLFILRDGTGCVLASATIFYLGYVFGENFHTIIHYAKFYESIFVGIITFIIIIFIAFLWWRGKI